MTISWQRIAYVAGGGIAIAVVGHLTLHGDLQGEHYGTAFLALLGTFIGAWAAFRRDKSQEAIKTEDRHVEALNRALFVLMHQNNSVVGWLKPFEDFPAPEAQAFSMPARKPVGADVLRQDFDTLNFLLSENEGGFLFKLLLEQQRFDSATEACILRANFHKDDYQEAMKRHNVPSPVTVEFIKSLGGGLYQSGMMYAKFMYAHLSLTRDSTAAVAEEGYQVGKRLFPNRKFLRFTATEVEMPVGTAEMSTPEGFTEAGYRDLTMMRRQPSGPEKKGAE